LKLNAYVAERVYIFLDVKN